MSTEQLVQWIPLPNLMRQHSLKGFVFKDTDLEIVLKELKVTGGQEVEKKLRVIFRNSVVLHRITNESLRISVDNPAIDNTGQLAHTWTFYKVINSKLINWIRKESVQEKEIESLLIHFICGDIESYIEVVATAEPKVEWIP